jgi:hypothetical protein
MFNGRTDSIGSENHKRWRMRSIFFWDSTGTFHRKLRFFERDPSRVDYLMIIFFCERKVALGFFRRRNLIRDGAVDHC